jgi:excinuclease ABC subunit B
MDADKEGFLRNERSLIQTMGRAARNVNGHVLLYAARVTDNMARAISETERRRALQEAYNTEHGITPITIRRAIDHPLAALVSGDFVEVPLSPKARPEVLADLDIEADKIPKLVVTLRKEMRTAATQLDFERAAELRDQIRDLEAFLIAPS